MPDDIYIINLIAQDGETVTRQDQLPGPDWLVFTGDFAHQTDIRLSWDTSFGASISGSGIYFVTTETGIVGSRLIVEGFIENARGSTGEDFIQGNEGGNIIYGDFDADGDGGNDVIWGAAGNDTLYGGAGDDEVSGDDGDDIMFGNAGRDTITGNSGIDRIEGGQGRDVLIGGADAGDTVTYYQSDAGVTLRITFGSATKGRGGDAQGDTVSGFTDVVGSSFDDKIVDTVAGTIAFGYNDNLFDGGQGDDLLKLGGGNDVGIGGPGNDEIFGGVGEDQIVGGDDDDYLDGGADKDILSGDEGADVLLGRNGNDSLTGGAGDDRLLGGNGKDDIDGNAGDDLLRGEDGRDRLDGGYGADRLIGGEGGDRLTGGGGADSFLLIDPADSGVRARTRDRILDFDHDGGDLIDLSAIDALPATAGNDAFEFVGHLAFSGAPGELRLRDTPDGIMVYLNLDTDRGAEITLFVQDVDLLRESDFLL